MLKNFQMKDLKESLSLYFKKNSLKRLWPIGVIFFVVFAFFWKVFLRGEVPIPGDFVVGVYYPWLDYKWGYTTGVPVKNPLTTDVVSFTYPMQTLAVEILKTGRIPLWNPYILAGTPLLANFQSAPFSPTNLVYLLFDKLWGWSIQVVLQHLLAAFFTYLLLRVWKVSKTGSVFGAVIFAFSGFNLIWSQWNGHTLAASFIPLILLFVDRWVESPKVLWGLGVSVALALQIISGYPQVVFYTFLAIALLVLVRLRIARQFLIKIALLALFLSLGLGLSAFQILPGAELLSLSQRETEPHPFEWAFLPWKKVITFFAPDYFGNHSTQNYWGPQDYTSNTGFVGVVGFVLAGLSITLFKKSIPVRFSFLLLFISLVFAFPTPVSILLWRSGILGLQAASAHRVLVLFNLAVAILAGFGVDRLFQSRKIDLRLSLFVPYFVVGGFGLATLYLFLTTYQKDASIIRGIPRFWVALRNLVIPTGLLLITTIIVAVSTGFMRFRKIGVGILFGLLVLELFRFGWKFTPFSAKTIVFPKTPVIDFLALERENPVRVTGSKVIPANMRMPYRLESLEGYDAVYPLRISQFISSINSRMSGVDPTGRYGTVDNDTSFLMDLVNTRYYLAIKRDQNNRPSEKGDIPSYYPKERFEKAFEDKSVVVLESKSSLPRAFMVYDWETERNERKILDRLLDVSFPVEKKVIIEKDVSMNRFTGTTSPAFSAEYLEYRESESTLTVKTERAGLLFVSDTFYPGWRAYLDKRETEIFRADFAFRAVSVPEGTHTVRFVYKPDSFYNGLKISFVSFLGLLFLPLLVKARWQKI